MNEGSEPFRKLFYALAVVAVVVAVASVVSVVGTITVASLRSSQGVDVGSATASSSKKIWVGKFLTTCSEEWQQKKVSFDIYLKSLGVNIFDNIIAQDPTLISPECNGCDCLSGDVLYLEVYKESLGDLSGFVESEPPEQ